MAPLQGSCPAQCTACGSQEPPPCKTSASAWPVDAAAPAPPQPLPTAQRGSSLQAHVSPGKERDWETESGVVTGSSAPRVRRCRHLPPLHSTPEMLPKPKEMRGDAAWDSTPLPQGAELWLTAAGARGKPPKSPALSSAWRISSFRGHRGLASRAQKHRGCCLPSPGLAAASL